VLSLFKSAVVKNRGTLGTWSFALSKGLNPRKVDRNIIKYARVQTLKE